ncbi:MAG: T9SS type A sorting domain-containing protein, partial [Bacteroidota bacterium]|nr:T9SS type A sorting domain-containing protein [Bacteroidota bacterium]
NWNNIPDRTAQITLLRVSSISDDEGFATAFPEQITATEVVGVTETAIPRSAATQANATKAKKAKEKAKQKDKDDDTDLPDYSKLTPHAVTISNTGRGNLKLKNLGITGENAGEFHMIGQPDAKPNKPVKIRKNSSVTFNVVFIPTSQGRKTAKLEAVSTKKKDDQTVSVELIGFGIQYEGSDTTNVDSLASNINNTAAKVSKKLTDKEPILSVFPNPQSSGSKIHLNLADFAPQEPVTLSLYDTYGQLYQAKTIVVDGQGSTSAEIFVNKTLKPGIYIIKANAGSGKKEIRIIVE